MIPYRGPMSLIGQNPYGMYVVVDRQGTGRHCGDPSPGSSKPRNDWWPCHEPLTAPFTSEEFIFRCPKHVGVPKRVLKARFDAQQSGQQSGGQQNGGQQSGGQQSGVVERVNNLSRLMGVGIDTNASIFERVVVLETTLWGNTRAGTLVERVAALEDLIGTGSP